MNKLTANQLLLLNRKYVEGGDRSPTGIVCPPYPPEKMELLTEIANIPYQTDSGDFYIYRGIAAKAAKLACTIVSRRPFEQGNHGTALLALLTFLKINGQTVIHYHQDMRELCDYMDEQDLEQCCAWIRAHTIEA